MMTAISVNAQTNLTGRVYHNPNIMAPVIEQKIDSKVAEARKKAIDKKEKEKGRKLTKEERSWQRSIKLWRTSKNRRRVQRIV